MKKENSTNLCEELTSAQKAEIKEALIENGNVVHYETIMTKHR